MTEQMDSRFLTARKNYIQRQFFQLNDMQRQAVLTTEGPLLLLAGAGSGKTTVLINRIANLMRFGRGSDCCEISHVVTEDDVAFLENLGDDPSPDDTRRADSLCAVEPAVPWSIIAITFTNKAANEMKERLSNLLGSQAQDIWAMTFHSACCRILRRDIERMGFTRSFTIYDSSDSERIMKEIIKDMELDDKTFPAKYVLGAISREKDKMVSPGEMLDRAERTGDIRAQHIARAYGKYQTRLKDNNALDFDDIIYITVQLLQQNEDVLQYYQRKFRAASAKHRVQPELYAAVHRHRHRRGHRVRRGAAGEFYRRAGSHHHPFRRAAVRVRQPGVSGNLCVHPGAAGGFRLPGLVRPR